MEVGKSLADIGIQNVGLVSADTREQIDEDTVALLARTLNSGNVIGFIGSGVSAGYGYPSWHSLIKDIASFVLYRYLVLRRRKHQPDFMQDSETINLLTQFVGLSLVHGLQIKKPTGIERTSGAEHDGAVALSLYDAIRQLEHDAATVDDVLRCRLFENLEVIPDRLCENQQFDPTFKDLIAEQVGKDNVGEFFEKLRNTTNLPSENDLRLVVAESCKKTLDRYLDLSLPNAKDGLNYSQRYSVDSVIKFFLKKKESDSKSEVLDTLYNVLGIHRFITINFDSEIEESCFGRPPDKQLTYNEKKLADLIDFGFSHDPKCRVFHLHGVNLTGGGELVIAERDYQETYLRDDSRSRTYRKTFESILRSNPLIFVGVGMTEDDVLRPFRRFLSERRVGEVQRPLFAIMGAPRSTLDASAHSLAAQRRLLYARYGVKVVYYPYEKHETRTQDLQNFLVEDVAESRRAWWSSWRMKPVLRRPATTSHAPPHSFMHGNSYRFSSVTKRIKIHGIDLEKLTRIPSTIVIAPQGAGKGLLAHQLANHRTISETTPLNS